MLFHALPETTLHVSQTCLCRAWNEVIDTRHFWERKAAQKFEEQEDINVFPFVRCCYRGLHYST